MITPKIKDVKVGMVFRTKWKSLEGKIYTNYARVTKKPFFSKPGDRADIFYAVFVNPKNFRNKRLSDDREFAVWQSEYEGKFDGRKWGIRVK